jgi:hypothetical protein
MLDRIRIASPCSASWDLMKGDDQVRFCSHCEKHVYNLSAMSRRDAETLLRETGASVCTRFYQRQDGTILTEDCPIGLQTRAAKVRQRLSFAVSSLLGFASAFGQSPQEMQSLVQLAQRGSLEISGVVTDPTEAVIPNARLELFDDKPDHVLAHTTTNGIGQFQFKDVAPGRYYVHVEMLGFRGKRILVDVTKSSKLTVRLDVGQVIMCVMVEAVTPQKLR